MRLINFTIECENDDISEWNLREWMNKYATQKYVKTLKNADHVKDDKHYKKLLKSKKDLQKNIDNYIDSKRC